MYKITDLYPFSIFQIFSNSIYMTICLTISNMNWICQHNFIKFKSTATYLVAHAIRFDFCSAFYLSLHMLSACGLFDG
jgi:hypothetical protein